MKNFNLREKCLGRYINFNNISFCRPNSRHNIGKLHRSVSQLGAQQRTGTAIPATATAATGSTKPTAQIPIRIGDHASDARVPTTVQRREQAVVLH